MTTRSSRKFWHLLPVYVLTSVLLTVFFDLAHVSPFGSAWTGLIWFFCFVGLAATLKGLLWLVLLMIKPKWSDALRT